MKSRLTIALLLSFIASSVYAQTTPFFPFEDSFDGPIDDDDPVTWKSGGLPSTLTVQNGDLILSEPFQLDGFSLGLTEIWKDDARVLAGDFSARAVVRVSAPHVFAGLFGRGQDESGDGGAYFCNIRGSGLITVGSFTGETLTLETTLDVVNNDVVLQLDAFGDDVTASAWLAGARRRSDDHLHGR